MPSFGNGVGSLNFHEMRLSGLPGIGILISPSLRTYTANISIWRGSIPMYASIFLITLSGDSTSFSVGKTLNFMMLTCLCRLMLKFPMNE